MGELTKGCCDRMDSNHLQGCVLSMRPASGVPCCKVDVLPKTRGNYIGMSSYDRNVVADNALQQGYIGSRTRRASRVIQSREANLDQVGTVDYKLP